MASHRHPNAQQTRVLTRSTRALRKQECGISVSHIPVKKLSVALDETVAARVAQAANRAGVSVSAWLNHAAGNGLSIGAVLDAAREWETDHGELTADELAAADSPGQPI